MNATNRAELIAEAYAKLRLARKALGNGDKALANGALEQARDRFRAVGMSGMVAWCDRWAGGQYTQTMGCITPDK